MVAEPGPGQYWDDVYRTKGADQVSWFQPQPTLSLQLIDRVGLGPDAGVVDIGGGASLLVDRLVERGFADLTVLDVSSVALDLARRRLGADAPVTGVNQDVLRWVPPRRYGLWHDRAVFHFLTEARDRSRYLDTLRRALEPRGIVIVATFAADGPEYCSGLPVVRYDAEQLAAALGAGFEPLATEREVHVTPAGAVQAFTWMAARQVRRS